MWSRGVTTNYTYNAKTGELASVAYSDGTPSLSYAYDRLGSIKTVTDVRGTRTQHYRLSDLQPDYESLPEIYGQSRQIACLHDQGTGRFSGLEVQMEARPPRQ